MLKKAIIAGSITAIAMAGLAGAAYASDSDDAANTHCNSSEVHKQSNKGHQLVGGNVDVNRISGGVIQGQVDKVPGICPSVGNNNNL